MAWASSSMIAVFLGRIPRMSIPRAKSFAFAFKLSKLGELVETPNTYVLEMINMVMALVTWLLLFRNIYFDE